MKTHEAFSFAQLERVCCLQEEDFQRYAKPVGDGDMRYWVKDNGSNILAVAHLDSVQRKRWARQLILPVDQLVYSPVLDDRLGAYVILDLLPKFGIKTDWLLTTGEESCNSTACLFDTTKKYNWIFSFDRMGTDCVMYGYETGGLAKLVTSYGWTRDWGSYSDICELEHLGCSGFNFGVGYHDYHSEYAYMKLSELTKSVRHFRAFHADFKDKHFLHAPQYSYSHCNRADPFTPRREKKSKAISKKGSRRLQRGVGRAFGTGNDHSRGFSNTEWWRCIYCGNDYEVSAAVINPVCPYCRMSMDGHYG